MLWLRKRDAQAPGSSRLCHGFYLMLGPPHFVLPPISHPSKALSPGSVPTSGSRGTAVFSSHLCPIKHARTCEDGLVNPQGGGPDFDDPDVRWHLVTDYKDKRRAAPSGAPSPAHHLPQLSPE